ncbi:MAG: hypothetical protein ABIV25_08480 [Paracoccaceae bacterium]
MTDGTDLIESTAGVIFRPRWPKLRLGAAVVALTCEVGRAAAMAYVEPYRIDSSTNSARDKTCPDGRDPRW